MSTDADREGALADRDGALADRDGALAVRDGSLAASVGGVRRRLVEATPARVKRSLAGPYNRIQEFKADRRFRRRSLPDLTAAADAPDHVVVVVVDAARADAVDHEVAPFLADRLVGSAVSPAPWTFPAVSSLVTGRYPHDHGAMRRTDEADTGSTDLTVPPTIADDCRTVVDAAAGAGYDTYGAFAFHMPFFALAGRFGRHACYDDADAGTVLADHLDWASARDRTLAYLHLSDLHEPVDPPARYWRAHEVDPDIEGLSRWRFVTESDPGPEGRRYRRHRRRLYRAALDAVDDSIASWWHRARDRLDGDLALLVTADHGEGLWELTAFDAATFVDSRPAYCVDHGGTPYESVVRVPLAVEGFPAVAAADRDGRASLVDVAPTIAARLGLADALPATGRDLATGVPADRVPLVEATRYGHERKAAYLDGWKVIVSEGDDVVAGFSLPDGQPTDAAGVEPFGTPVEEPTALPEQVRRRLLDALPPWPDGEDASVRVSGPARRRLEDLGYV